MAFTRLEKIGTIYSRITSLIRGGAMKEEDKPLWYIIYKAFPPKYEPTYNRQMPEYPITDIFYEEDVIRAKFHQNVKQLPAINLKSTKGQSATEKFLSRYSMLQKTGLSSTDAYNKALKEYLESIDKTHKKQKFV